MIIEFDKKYKNIINILRSFSLETKPLNTSGEDCVLIFDSAFGFNSTSESIFSNEIKIHAEVYTIYNFYFSMWHLLDGGIRQFIIDPIHERIRTETLDYTRKSW